MNTHHASSARRVAKEAVAMLNKLATEQTPFGGKSAKTRWPRIVPDKKQQQTGGGESGRTEISPSPFLRRCNRGTSKRD